MKVTKILVSQPESSSYSGLKNKKNIHVDFWPFIKTENLSLPEIRKQKIDFSSFGAVIFTSKNAMDHYFRVAKEMRFEVPDSMKYFCPIEAIAYYLQKYVVYRKRKIYVGEKDFKSLLPFFKKQSKEKFILPSSNIINPEITTLLDTLELEWKRAILFNTISSDLSNLNYQDYQIIVFFTPAGIKSLFDNFSTFKQGNIKIATFGKGTFDYAYEMGLKVDIKVPSLEYSSSMVMALEKYLKKEGILNNKEKVSHY